MFGIGFARFGSIAWFVQSPDLSLPDFFVWELVKDCVFQRRIMTFQELKAVVDKVAAIAVRT